MFPDLRFRLWTTVTPQFMSILDLDPDVSYPRLSRLAQFEIPGIGG